MKNIFYCLPLEYSFIALRLFEENAKISASIQNLYQNQCFVTVEIDVSLGIIFLNCQANNYMTSPVSISLNFIKICQVSQVFFYRSTDFILVVAYVILFFLLILVSWSSLHCRIKLLDTPIEHDHC